MLSMLHAEKWEAGNGPGDEATFVALFQNTTIAKNNDGNWWYVNQ